MFDSRSLRKMILPLFLEQFLVMLVGLADTFIISFAGESAVSGVSLVTQFNTIFIYLFTALAAGGAVVLSQYIGRREYENAGESASQLVTSSVGLALVIGAVTLIFNRSLMGLMFGKVERDVMDACVTYLRITAYSYPALALYNAGAALYRSMGKTSATMYISIVANVINVVGNLIGVLVLKAGVAGVAYPSLISYTFSAVAITILCFKGRNDVKYKLKWILKWNGSFQKKILRIAVPNGVENGIFQLVKVALSSVVALFGTYQIAANGVAQSIWSLAALASVAMEPVYITVIGQCMGAGEKQQAEHYFARLTKITFIFAIAWNALILALTPLFTQFFNISDEAKRLVFWLVVIHNSASAFVHPLAFPFGKGLRAAGDVTFTAVVSIISSLVGRLLFSLILGLWLNLGVIGIAMAMCIDWAIRGVIFLLRYRSKKWQNFSVI